MAITGNVPKIDEEGHDKARQAAVTHSLDYTGLEGGAAIVGCQSKRFLLEAAQMAALRIFKRSPSLPSDAK